MGVYRLRRGGADLANLGCDPAVKRSPLKRGKPLERSAGRPKEERKPTRHARRERDWDRMAWCKQQRCALAELNTRDGELWHGGPADPCNGAVEAHHAGDRAGWRRAADDTVIPLCHHHHACRTDHRGVFAGWPRGAIKAWELAVVDLYQLAYSTYRTYVLPRL